MAADGILQKIDQKGNIIVTYSTSVPINADAVSACGVEFDGEFLWCVGLKNSWDGTTGFVYKMNLKGNLIKRFAGAGIDGFGGITTDRKDLIFGGSGQSSGYAGFIVKDNKLSSVRTIGTDNNLGLAFDGEHIYGVDFNLRSINVYARNSFDLVRNFTPPSLTIITGITFNGNNLAVVESGKFLYILDRAGNLINILNLDISYVWSDVCFDGEFYWLFGDVTVDG